MLRKYSPLRPQEYSPRQRHRRHAAFTLVEVLVALAVMMLMMVIILVPINMGLDLFHIGKARAEVQQANQLVINQLTAELRQAVHVFPNEKMPGITNKLPYSASATQKPYFALNTATDCEVSNTSRIDFLLPVLSVNGNVQTPTEANNYIVTYYARRLQADPTVAYDPYSNPVVLWRAQYPYRLDDGTDSATVNAKSTRYPAGTCGAATANTGSGWLTQNQWGEPNLLPFASYSSTAVKAGHTLVTPRDMVLAVPASNLAATPPAFQPSSSFTGDDTNGDGKIDRVTINLLLAKFDAIGAGGEGKSQQIHASQTVDLPNIR